MICTVWDNVLAVVLTVAISSVAGNIAATGVEAFYGERVPGYRIGEG